MRYLVFERDGGYKQTKELLYRNRRCKKSGLRRVGFSLIIFIFRFVFCPKTITCRVAVFICSLYGISTSIHTSLQALHASARLAGWSCSWALYHRWSDWSNPSTSDKYNVRCQPTSDRQRPRQQCHLGRWRGKHYNAAKPVRFTSMEVVAEIADYQEQSLLADALTILWFESPQKHHGN